MRFRQGYRFSLSPVCGMCRCGPGGRWICPQNGKDIFFLFNNLYCMSSDFYDDLPDMTVEYIDLSVLHT